ncbi:MAG: HNH endonuclease [Actinomycetota bacterium]|nr:HNH endonuclease [Actinomycetota bacterium]
MTVAGTTLLGLDEKPGELAGYGPIPADVARAVARDATWRALLTDPSLGTVQAVGEHRYRPGTVLTRDVMARDRTCTFAGCAQPASRCDLDHREPFDSKRPAHQQTHRDNLQALCRFHHNLKTLHGWQSTFDARSGITSWTSPLGTTYHREPEPALPPWESWLTRIETLPRPKSPCMCAVDAPPTSGQPPPTGPPPF